MDELQNRREDDNIQRGKEKPKLQNKINKNEYWDRNSPDINAHQSVRRSTQALRVLGDMR